MKTGDCFLTPPVIGRKEGAGGLEADTDGHTSVPKEGERIKMFVNDHQGKYDGVYPNWYEASL